MLVRATSYMRIVDIQNYFTSDFYVIFLCQVSQPITEYRRHWRVDLSNNDYHHFLHRQPRLVTTLGASLKPVR